MTTDTVDQQILNAFGLLAVLLVFVFAYLAALIPQFSALVALEPVADDDKRRVRRQMTALQVLFGGNGGAALAVLCVLIPLSSQALASLGSASTFPTVKAGMLLADAFLFLTVGVAVWSVVHLQQNKPDSAGCSASVDALSTKRLPRRASTRAGSTDEPPFHTGTA